jgi:hypothetical protein
LEEDMSMLDETFTMSELLDYAEAITGRRFQVRILRQAVLYKEMEELAQNDLMK